MYSTHVLEKLALLPPHVPTPEPQPLAPNHIRSAKENSLLRLFHSQYFPFHKLPNTPKSHTNMVDQIASPARVLLLTGSDNFSYAATALPWVQRGQRRALNHLLLLPRLWTPEPQGVWGFHRNVTEDYDLQLLTIRRYTSSSRAKGPWRMENLTRINYWNIISTPICINSLMLMHRHNFYLRIHHKIKIKMGLKIIK